MIETRLCIRTESVKAAATDTVRFCFKFLCVKRSGAYLTEHSLPQQRVTE